MLGVMTTFPLFRRQSAAEVCNEDADRIVELEVGCGRKITCVVGRQYYLMPEEAREERGDKVVAVSECASDSFAIGIYTGLAPSQWRVAFGIRLRCCAGFRCQLNGIREGPARLLLDELFRSSSAATFLAVSLTQCCETHSVVSSVFHFASRRFLHPSTRIQEARYQSTAPQHGQLGILTSFRGHGGNGGCAVSF
jgi:hypothetical protein